MPSVDPYKPVGTRRCVLLSGPAGSGKTTICRLGHQAMLDGWGEPAAAIDVDQLYLNVDARWELPYDDRRNAMILGQAAQLAMSLYEHGWPTVTICGNSLFEPRDTSVIISRLCGQAEVHHVTLTASLDVLLRRSADVQGRDLARLRRDFEVHTARLHPGTALLDSTELTAEQALSALVDIVQSGRGRLCQPRQT